MKTTSMKFRTFRRASSILLILLFGITFGQTNRNVYRIRLPHKDWSARLVGVTGYRTAGTIVSGSYRAKYGNHEFLVEKSGPYDLQYDPTGGTSWTTDADWDAGQDGKWIIGSDFLDVITDSILFDQYRNVVVPYSYDDDDADIMLIDKSGDVAWIWQDDQGNGFCLGHAEGQFLTFGKWDGQYAGTTVYFRGEHFIMTPRLDVDSLFHAHLDSAKNELNLWIKGNIRFGAGYDGDADLILENASGDSSWIWNENTLGYRYNRRGLYIGHHEGGMVVLGAWDGQYEEAMTVVRGEHFIMTPRMDADSLFHAHLDSANSEMDLWMKGTFILGPGSDHNADIWLYNLEGDTSRVWQETDSAGKGGLYLVHHPGQKIVLGSREEGYYGTTEAHGDFVVRPKSTKDTVFSVITDTTNVRCEVSITGVQTVVGCDTVASAATVALGKYNNFVITGTTNVDSIDTACDFPDFNIAYIEISDASGFTWTDGKNLLLAGNFVADQNDMLVVQRRGNNFIQISRSSN